MIKKRSETKTSSNSTTEDIEDSSPKAQSNKVILEVDPHQIRNWYLADRPESELVSVKQYAKEFANPKIGQKIPCVVRKVNDDKEFKFEIIAGEQRWRAAKLAGTTLKVIVKELTNSEAAIEQIIENKRDNLSDYAQGMNYSKLIKQKLLKQKDLESVINKSPVEINRLLAFSQVPTEVWNAIGNMSKVSARTASEIRALLKKHPEYLDKVIQLAPRLREGKLGAATLKRELSHSSNSGKKKPISAREVRTNSGRHLFTWRSDSNKNISISFPQDMRTQINQTELEKAVQNELERQINNIERG